MTNDDKNRQFLLYTAPDGAVRVEVFFQDETVWLTQKSLAELFGVDRSVVTKHLKNIFGSGELAENSVCAKIAHTAADGKKLLDTVLQPRRDYRRWIPGKQLPGDAIPLRPGNQTFER